MTKKIANPHHRSQPITQTNYNVLDQLKSAIESVTSKPAIRSGEGLRLQCPAHGGTKYSLFIGDGDKRLIVCCHSRHCDSKDIVEAAGLTLADLFYEQLTPQQRQINQRKKTHRQVEDECIHAWLILHQIRTDDEQ